jgi:hypothetical protein
MKLPQGFIANPQGFEDIEIPAPPKVEELVKLYHDRVAELGAKFPQDVLVSAVELVGLPEDTSRLKTPRRFGRDPLLGITGQPDNVNTIRLAHKMGVLPDEAIEAAAERLEAGKKPLSAWKNQYGETVMLAVQIYNEVVGAAYNDVVKLTNRNIEARQDLMKRGGGVYSDLPGKEGAALSVAKYNTLSPELKKKALLLTHGYVNTDQFDLTEPRVLGIQKLASGKEMGDADEETEEAPIAEAQDAGSMALFPAGQEQVKLGSIEVGQEKVIVLLEKVSEIIDASVFEIFEELKKLTTNIQAYFGNNLEDDKLATAAIDASESIGTKTAALADDKE